MQCNIIFLIIFLITSTTHASEVYKPCDPDHGFHFYPDKTKRIGFITHLTIDAVPGLTPDLQVYDPQDPSKQFPVFAVLRTASWGLQPTTPILLSGQISPDNQYTLALALKEGIAKPTLQFQFVVYDYNPQTQLYYKSFHSDNTDLRGQIEKQEDEDTLSLSVGDKPAARIPAPENYDLSISIFPTALQQLVHIALTPDKPITRPWRSKHRY